MTPPPDSGAPIPPSRGLARIEPEASESAGEDAKVGSGRSRRFGFASFAAQMLGGAPRRGLRGGPETLERARDAYLQTEWSGPSDRRPRPGRITKTEI